MSDPERIIRETINNPPKVGLTPLQKLGRAISAVLGLAALVLALVVLVEQDAASSCAYQNATAQHDFTQAMERLFLPQDATRAQRKAAADQFHHALDRYDASSADYQQCVR